MDAFRSAPSSSRLARHRTAQLMHDSASKKTLRSRYRVNWFRPLGEGTFGTVYSAVDRQTNEKVALKKLPKKHTDDLLFTREMDALMHLRQEGGHPNICGLRENFEEGNHYYITLDLIEGGEMFDHLVNQGAYSEADASRLIREVASALAFMHGIGMVHGDLKPENLMLSTNNPSDACIKIVDFGCAQITLENNLTLKDLEAATGGKSANNNNNNNNDDDDDDETGGMIGNTPAYCPPEVLDEDRRGNSMDPAMDMWALGIILYIMLTGLHPFDLNGASTDDEILERIIQQEEPPLRNSPITAHLSESAVDLIEKLIKWDAKDRITALDMLEHPWVQGKTATRSKMENSDKRLSMHRYFKTQLEARIFADIVQMAPVSHDDADIAKRTSLIERAFRKMDPNQKGYISGKDLKKIDGSVDQNAAPLSLSGFSDLLSVNMKNKHLPKGHVVYREGDVGNHMYFINSGTIEVTTKDGSKTRRGPGDFFGEGALVNPRNTRSATIETVTPVHAMEISREYFEKYMATSEGGGLSFTLKEKDKTRKRNRAKEILRAQNSLNTRSFRKGDHVYKVGQEGSELFILESGDVDVMVEDYTVFKMKPGDMCGEHSLLFARPRNTTAVCRSDMCKFQVMRALDFYKFMENFSAAKEGIEHMCLRREFQKALVFKTKRPFPTNERDLRAAFNAVDDDRTGNITLDNVRQMLTRMDPTLEEKDVQAILQSLDLDQNGVVTFSEFKKIFLRQ